MREIMPDPSGWRWLEADRAQLELRQPAYDECVAPAPRAGRVVADAGQPVHRLAGERAQREQVEVLGAVDEALGRAGPSYEPPPDGQVDRARQQDRHQRDRELQPEREVLDVVDLLGAGGGQLV